MDEQTWNRVKQIFHEAVGRPAAQRDAFLAEACADDALVRSEVEDLLAAHDEVGDPKTASVADEGGAREIEGAGATIGRYKLLQRIGEGGFGVVYMAEQEEPIRRRVALKIIKLGMDTKQVVARFEAERQALALMDHPNIAKVLEAGATDTGRPYFVMELVKGVSITEYCDANTLSTSDRLRLFVEVCHAVQHAHQKGIIHRDIKPTNVMVTLHDGTAVPKVIDFGVAKAMHQRLTEKTLFTAYGQFIGTPAYMSPEQAEISGLDIDTRSDVYSLGALLYELRRDPANAQGSRAAETVDAPDHARSGCRGNRETPADRSRSAGPAHPGRSGLDRDEGAGEGPNAALRVGLGSGRRHRAALRSRAGHGPTAEPVLPA